MLAYSPTPQLLPHQHVVDEPRFANGGGEGEQLTGVAGRGSSHCLANGAEGQCEIGAGIAIRYRKNMEAVEVPARAAYSHSASVGRRPPIALQ